MSFNLKNAVVWKAVMAFTAGMFVTSIMVFLFPATAVLDITSPVRYPTNGLMNVFPENINLPG
jgi:hypothetical protein